MPAKRPRMQPVKAPSATKRPHCANWIRAHAAFVARIAKRGHELAGEYVNAATKVAVRCENGHIYTPRPSQLLFTDGGCGICGGKNPAETKRLFFDWVAKSGARVVGEYGDVNTPVECRCASGHACWPRPSSVRSAIGICAVCAKRDSADAERRFRVRIGELKGMVSGEYKGAHVPIACTCERGHECWPRPANVLYGHGMCRICIAETRNIAESKLGELLKKIGTMPVRQFRLPPPHHVYTFDFEVNGVAVEFDGGQHFHPVEWWGGEEEFKNQRERDLAKCRTLAAQGRRLVRLHYEWIYTPEASQLDFLRVALAHTAPLVVSDLQRYSWLKDAGFDIVTVGQ